MAQLRDPLKCEIQNNGIIENYILTSTIIYTIYTTHLVYLGNNPDVNNNSHT